MNIPEDFAQVNLIFSGSALPNGAQVAFGVEPTDPVDNSPSAIAGRVVTAWNDSGIEAQICNTVTMSNVLVKLGPNATGASGLFGGAGPGTNAGVAAPPNTTFLVGKNTLSGGRAGRGRMYIPGVPEVNINEAGVLSPAAVTAMQGALNSWLGKLDVAHVGMVVLHAESTTIITEPLEVVDLTLSSKVATQRRRLRR